ncbi:MAG: molybdate ABC transporter substrate-binding protein [Gallionellales bacterium 35-53-114]|nr:MAG: molybdate ABC transporter substrate-binding protein [Gallionellales bacterium 35-53-114]OYZ65199.1 MAG: molybdate ABC transporter substrate-binding protein [Gallionellales bacterium 24-53-125]OZB08105.1 MAG: molybdate ABC transporter substrate-binding protein [Gallionellales bacterium 39-52-133]HQS58025.1 molybdate ABC transporter substrate-binding protein [Gallionellaceae bacterium]HQS73581.1 molybdate ABC transporter substrate-binding protein [Gallionellaceae bacterium]
MKLFARLLGIVTLSVGFNAVAAESLTVAVAANVKFVFDELKTEFRKSSGIDAKGVFASSGKITAQIKSGAPYDVFLSADMEFPQALYQDGFAVAAPKVYARGVLVLWTLQPLDLSQGLVVLATPAVKKVAMANPKLAPYGREAMHALDYFKLRSAVEPRLIYGESIAQVNQYIDTRSVEIGFTAKSVVLAPQMQGRGKWIEVPRESYQPIEQGLVLLKHGAQSNAAAAKLFIEFMASAKARAILDKFGYILP